MQGYSRLRGFVGMNMRNSGFAGAINEALRRLRMWSLGGGSQYRWFWIAEGILGALIGDSMGVTLRHSQMYQKETRCGAVATTSGSSLGSAALMTSFH